jgi:hypothetical protein
MWRLYPPLKSLWTVLVSVLVAGILLGVLGNCAYDALSSEGCTLTLNPRNLLRPSILGIILALLLLGILRLVAGRSYRRHEAPKSFALLKRADELRPEDLGFQMLRPGEPSDPHKRPFYPLYIPRSASEENRGSTYTEAELVEELQAGRNLLLLGQPLDGKSRTIYEIVRNMDGYQVVRPSPSKEVPHDDDFFLVKGEKVIFLLKDLQNYLGRRMDLLEFHRKISGPRFLVCGGFHLPRWPRTESGGDKPRKIL